MRVILNRNHENKKQTVGTIAIYDDDVNFTFGCFTLELPWRDNKTGISRFPPDKYKVTKYDSPTKGEVFLLHDVPNRTYIEIHIGNFAAKIVSIESVKKGVATKEEILNKAGIYKNHDRYDIKEKEKTYDIYKIKEGDIRGCVIVGDDLVDINNDDLRDVVNSATTMEKLYEILPEEFEIEVYDCF